MAKHPWLFWRQEKDGTKRWYLRARVPLELVTIIGKKEIKRSLRTTDRKEADQRVGIEAVKVQQEFADARRKLDERPRSIADYSETDLQRLVLLWFQDRERQSAGENLSTLDSKEHEAATDELAFDEATLRDPDNPNTLASVQAHADAILVDHGWPAKPHRVGEIGTSTTVADVDKSRPEYHRLCELVHRAMLENVRRDQSRLKGDPVGAVFDPIFAGVSTTSAPEAMSVVESPTFSEIRDKWLSEREPPPKTESEWRTAVRRFEEVNGRDLPVASITKSHVRDFKDKLLKIPTVLPHKLRGLSVPEIIKATAKDDRPRLSPKAVNKQLTAIRSLLSWAESNGYIEANPASGMSVAEAKNARDKRLPYSEDDLKVIIPSLTKYRDRQPARYWMPLLALYTGARMEELGQLVVGDVRHRDGVDFLDINTEGDGKSLKTKSSVRQVPIHPELIKLGFLDYVAERRNAKDKMVFSDLKPDKLGTLTGNLSKWYGRHVRHLGITDRRKVFHSFRHTFKDACRAARITEEVHDSLTGHAGGGVGRTYGGGVPLEVKSEEVAKVRFPGLDLSHLHTE